MKRDSKIWCIFFRGGGAQRTSWRVSISHLAWDYPGTPLGRAQRCLKDLSVTWLLHAAVVILTQIKGR